MNPSVTSPVPARDDMGMAFIPVYAGEASAAGAVQLPASVVQRLGIRASPVATSALTEEIRAPGVVQFDARSVSETYAVTTGQVERLSVRSVGESVRAGQLLFELYSPALATVDNQYLQSLNRQTSSVENPYVNGLRTFGLTDELIADLREKRRRVGRIPYRAEKAGVVTALGARDGAVVAQGTSVLQWMTVDPIWVLVDVPASQAGGIELQGSAEVTLSGLAGRTLSARVDYLYPDLDPITRTARVRLVLRNPDGALRPNMTASVTFHRSDSAPVLHIPREAVIRDGRTDRVILALGAGRFAPREVKVGREIGDQVIVLEGLEVGDQVVTSGVFLLDSESNIRSSLARMEGNGRDAAKVAAGVP
jgi:Cu(I)/Ag(I) efflux system membrane fusion protein